MSNTAKSIKEELDAWLNEPHINTPYVDIRGRPWSHEKLDLILGHSEVFHNVLAGVSIGLEPDQTWSPARVLRWAKIRYPHPREDAAGLLLLLVTRYLDTTGAHLIGREPVQ